MIENGILVERIIHLLYDGSEQSGDVVVTHEGPSFLTCRGIAHASNGQMRSFTWVLDKKKIISRRPVPVKVMKKISVGE